MQVWCPLYMSKSEQLGTGGAVVAPTSTADFLSPDTNSESSGKGSANPMNMVKSMASFATFNDFTGGNGPEPKQKGHIHFSVEFYPVVKSKIIRPDVQKALEEIMKKEKEEKEKELGQLHDGEEVEGEEERKKADESAAAAAATTAAAAVAVPALNPVDVIKKHRKFLSILSFAF
ncbi:hypothetical protein HK102_012337 [Quaeritorhiza haematococci]|nr:hypothetical protein HK102_012337 [Quaeritorhiza haematococci]